MEELVRTPQVSSDGPSDDWTVISGIRELICNETLEAVTTVWPDAQVDQRELDCFASAFVEHAHRYYAHGEVHSRPTVQVLADLLIHNPAADTDAHVYADRLHGYWPHLHRLFHDWNLGGAVADLWAEVVWNVAQQDGMQPHALLGPSWLTGLLLKAARAIARDVDPLDAGGVRRPGRNIPHA